MKLIRMGLAWAGAASVLAAFWMPWVFLDVREPDLVRQLRQSTPLGDTIGGLAKDLGRITVKIREGARTVTGELPSLADLPRQISGADVPGLAQRKDAQVVVALMELLTQSDQQVGMKVQVVYLVPGIALLLALALTFAGTIPPAAWAVACASAGIAGIGFWKLLTAKTQAVFVGVTIGPGLWLSLWGYVGLALAAVLWAVSSIRARPRKDGGAPAV